jgi:phosphatidylglycerophosphatase A
MSRLGDGVALALATWFGCGYFPKSPGTVGSLGAVAAAWVLVVPLGLPPAALGVAAALLLWPSVWAANRACRRWQSEDPQRVVVDEVVGQWITLAAAPRPQWGWWAAAFLLFRVFDILKPFPVRAAERLPGGWGVVADDLAAGVYGAVILTLLLHCC